MKNTIKEAIANSMSYDAYIEMVGKLVDAKATTGTEQTEILTNFTKLNYKRMTRLNKTVHVSEKLVETVRNITPVQNKLFR